MSVIYLITLFALFFTILLLKKSTKKTNVLSSIVYTSCIIFFYDVFIAYVLTGINLKNTLLLYSLIYILTSLILIGINYHKNKKIVFQKYYLDQNQLIGFIIIILVCFTVGFFKYNKFGEIDYLITDAALHYKMADYYSITQKMFNVALNDGVKIYDKAMTGFYVPCGILMNIMPCAKYISYNLFNTSVLCLTSLTAYILCLEIKNNKKNNILSVFLVLMYTLAYPLSYMIYGFGYLGSGIIAITLIIYTWKLILKEERKSLYLVLTLFNFSLFFSYYLFVPVIYLAQGLFIIYRYMRGNYKLITLFIIGFITLIVPTIIGYMYFVYTGSVSSTVSTSASNFLIEGSAYKNLWGNFVLLIPMIIYAIITEIKNKKIDFDIFMLVIELIYIFITLYLTTKSKMSTYYYYKSYYVLWIICYVYIYKLINNSKYKTNLIINYSLIILMIIITITEFEQKVIQSNINFSSTPVGKELASVYAANYNTFNPHDVVDKDLAKLMLETTKYDKKCELKGKNKTLPYAGNFYQKLWYYGLTSNTPTINYNKEMVNNVFIKAFDYKEFLETDKVKCAVIPKAYLEKNKINIRKHQILYKNKAGYLIKK